MKAHTFKRNSWHYKLAMVGESRHDEYKFNNICSYTRAVIGGALLAFFGSILALIVAGMVFAGFYDIFMWMFLGGPVTPPMIIIGSVMGVITTIMAVVAARIYAHQHSDEPSNNFVIASYRKVKDKTCSRVDFE